MIILKLFYFIEVKAASFKYEYSQDLENSATSNVTEMLHCSFHLDCKTWFILRSETWNNYLKTNKQFLQVGKGEENKVIQWAYQRKPR